MGVWQFQCSLVILILEGVERDAQNCLEMAMAMRQQMKILRERWVKMGYPPIAYSYGDFCRVLPRRGVMAHRTVWLIRIVGRDANLAARLQSAAQVDENLNFGRYT